MKKFTMNESSDSKPEQPPVSKRIISRLCIVNLIIVLFPLATTLSLLNYHPMTDSDKVRYPVLFIWLVCAIFLFFRSRIAWFCSLLGLGLMIYELARVSIHALESSAIDYFLTIFLILCLTVFFGLLKYRRAWK